MCVANDYMAPNGGKWYSSPPWVFYSCWPSVFHDTVASFWPARALGTGGSEFRSWHHRSTWQLFAHMHIIISLHGHVQSLGHQSCFDYKKRKRKKKKGNLLIETRWISQSHFLHFREIPLYLFILSLALLFILCQATTLICQNNRENC